MKPIKKKPISCLSPFPFARFLKLHYLVCKLEGSPGAIYMQKAALLFPRILSMGYCSISQVRITEWSLLLHNDRLLWWTFSYACLHCKLQLILTGQPISLPFNKMLIELAMHNPCTRCYKSCTLQLIAIDLLQIELTTIIQLKEN